jgi:O-antigen/teichoic acid export membrane protein
LLRKIKNIILNNPFIDSFKKGSYLLLANIIINIVSVISIPIFTQLLTVDDYGIFEVTHYYIRFFSIIFPLNTFASINYFWYRKDLNSNEVVGNILFVSTLFLFTFSGIYYIFQYQLADWFNLPLFSIQIIPICVVLGSYLSLYIGLVTIKQETKKNAIITCLNFISKVGLSIFLIYFVYHNYKGRLVAEIIGYIFIFLLTFRYILKSAILNFDFYLSRKILFYALSTILITSSGFILTYFDTLMINNSLGNEQAGLYSFAYKISTIYYGFVISFQTVLVAKYNQFFHDKNYSKIEDEIASLLKIVVLLSAFFILLSVDMGKMLASNNAYEKALFIAPIIIVGYFFFFIYEMYNIVLFQTKRNTIITIIILSSGVLNIILNKLLIPQFGFIVAAINTLFCYILMALFSYNFAHKKCDYAPPFRIFSKSIIFVIIISVVFYSIYFFDISFWISLPLKLFIITIIAIYLFKNQIKNYLKSND